MGWIERQRRILERDVQRYGKFGYGNLLRGKEGALLRSVRKQEGYVVKAPDTIKSLVDQGIDIAGVPKGATLTPGMILGGRPGRDPLRFPGGVTTLTPRTLPDRRPPELGTGEGGVFNAAGVAGGPRGVEGGRPRSFRGRMPGETVQEAIERQQRLKPPPVAQPTARPKRTPEGLGIPGEATIGEQISLAAKKALRAPSELFDWAKDFGLKSGYALKDYLESPAGEGKAEAAAILVRGIQDLYKYGTGTAWKFMDMTSSEFVRKTTAALEKAGVSVKEAIVIARRAKPTEETVEEKFTKKVDKGPDFRRPPREREITDNLWDWISRIQEIERSPFFMTDEEVEEAIKAAFPPSILKILGERGYYTPLISRDARDNGTAKVGGKKRIDRGRGGVSGVSNVRSIFSGNAGYSGLINWRL